MFWRFLLVGGLGFCIDASLTQLLIQLALAPWVARIPAILLAMTFTWLANRYFTYRVSQPHTSSEALRYVLVALTMALINYSVYCLLLVWGIWPLAAVTLSTICQTVISFHAYRYFVFMDRKNLTLDTEPSIAWDSPTICGIAHDSVYDQLNIPPPTKQFFRAATTAIFISLVASCVLTIVFLTLNLFVANLSPKPIDSAVREGFEEHELVEKDRLDGDFLHGIDQYNDCLIMQMALLKSGDAIKDALSPLMIPKNPNANRNLPVCKALHQYVNTKKDFKLVRYHRYLHGHRTLATFLLSYNNLKNSRLILKTSVYSLLVLLLADGIYRLVVSSRKKAEADDYFDSITQGGAEIIIALNFFGFYGLESFGQSFTHAPFAILAFLLILTAFRLNLNICKPIKWYFLSAIFGGFSMYFEFLSGPLPLGSAIILGLTAIFWKKNSWENIVNGLSALIIFILTAVGCYFLKIAITDHIFDGVVFSEVKKGLLFRTGNTAASYNQISKIYSSIDAINHLRWNFGKIAWNSQIAGYAVIVFCLIQTFSASIFTFIKGFPGHFKLRIFSLLLSTMGIIIWYWLFINHTVEHAWFMVRLMVWPIISGWLMLWLIAIELYRNKILSDAKNVGNGIGGLL